MALKPFKKLESEASEILPLASEIRIKMIQDSVLLGNLFYYLEIRRQHFLVTHMMEI